jgi:hypothetical protein
MIIQTAVLQTGKTAGTHNYHYTLQGKVSNVSRLVGPQEEQNVWVSPGTMPSGVFSGMRCNILLSDGGNVKQYILSHNAQNPSTALPWQRL